MILSVKERLLLMSCLPAQGNFLTMRIVVDLRRELSFSEEEHAALQFQNEGEGNVRWSPESDPMKDVAIGEKGQELLREGLGRLIARLDETAQVDETHIILAEKIGYKGTDDP